MVFATTPLTPDCNVFWSCAVHPLCIMYWSTIHRSRTSSSDHFTCCPLHSRTSYSRPSNPITFPATYPFFPFCRTVPPISSSPRAASLNFGARGGVWACRCPSSAHTIFSCTYPAIQFAWSCCIYSTMVKDRALTVLPRSPPPIQGPSPPPPSSSVASSPAISHFSPFAPLARCLCPSPAVFSAIF
jgi:hypothetical protein